MECEEERKGERNRENERRKVREREFNDISPLLTLGFPQYPALY